MRRERCAGLIHERLGRGLPSTLYFAYTHKNLDEAVSVSNGWQSIIISLYYHLFVGTTTRQYYETMSITDSSKAEMGDVHMPRKYLERIVILGYHKAHSFTTFLYSLQSYLTNRALLMSHNP